jgi:hypothetical protein
MLERNSINGKLLDRWYNQEEEWFKLDPAVRGKIIQARKKREISKVSVSKAEKSAN